MKVTLIRAWPRRFESVEVELPQGACVEDALHAAGWMDPVGRWAVFGEVVDVRTPLGDGDRIELLRPLQVDPKESRRRRAARRQP
ncbi:RnfH family protein [Novilysobacter spongiicola]|uniref:UPF0125 protein SAMN02745674_00357 n=1 Tax=Lysobacter spongiicola DSM 21749 TaxID=1122188 RepID=A0A1T4MB60_9GAMM|nr:RnfH family protein [Lysobacter spongiicola]SJZ64233.1 hypothetical protein SAMN02745674_00357 [Lysobacter spongiicola DSM 21749]